MEVEKDTAVDTLPAMSILLDTLQRKYPGYLMTGNYAIVLDYNIDRVCSLVQPASSMNEVI
jgi:hypothetical protein